MKGYVDIVNGFDKVIGKQTIYEATFNKKITRHIALILIDKNGNILLQKRSETKYLFPLHWDLSVTGFVDHGESYDEAVIREAREELGVEIIVEDLKLLIKKLIRYSRNEFTKLYIIKYSGEINIGKEEVYSFGFFSIEEINEKIRLGEKSTYIFSVFFEFYKKYLSKGN